MRKKTYFGCKKDFFWLRKRLIPVMSRQAILRQLSNNWLQMLDKPFAGSHEPA